MQRILTSLLLVLTFIACNSQLKEKMPNNTDLANEEIDQIISSKIAFSKKMDKLNENVLQMQGLIQQIRSIRYPYSTDPGYSIFDMIFDFTERGKDSYIEKSLNGLAKSGQLKVKGKHIKDVCENIDYQIHILEPEPANPEDPKFEDLIYSVRTCLNKSDFVDVLKISHSKETNHVGFSLNKQGLKNIMSLFYPDAVELIKEMDCQLFRNERGSITDFYCRNILIPAESGKYLVADFVDYSTTKEIRFHTNVVAYEKDTEVNITSIVLYQNGEMSITKKKAQESILEKEEMDLQAAREIEESLKEGKEQSPAMQESQGNIRSVEGKNEDKSKTDSSEKEIGDLEKSETEALYEGENSGAILE